MEIKKKCLLSLYVLIFVLTSSLCVAETSPMDCLEENFDEIIITLKSSEFANKTEKEQQSEMYARLNSNFDFQLISMLALGRNWKRFSPDQKNDFSKYLAHLIINIYYSKVRGKNLDGIRVDYIKAIDLKTKSRKRSDVYTIFHNGEYEIPVAYRMIQNKTDNWKIYDILIEGVSLVANYRDTYKQKLSVSPEKIISELKAKVDK